MSTRSSRTRQAQSLLICVAVIALTPSCNVVTNINANTSITANTDINAQTQVTGHPSDPWTPGPQLPTSTGYSTPSPVMAPNDPWTPPPTAVPSLSTDPAPMPSPSPTEPPVLITTFAGTGSPGYFDGARLDAQFNSPMGLTADAAGNLYVADFGSYSIRKILASGNVTTVAGSGKQPDGSDHAKQFYRPYDVAVDDSGTLYVVDDSQAPDGSGLFKVRPDGSVERLSISAKGAMSVAVGNNGELYVGDVGGHRILKVTSTGEVTTIAGNGTAGTADGTGAVAQVNEPVDLAVGKDGTVYFVDRAGFRVRKVSPSGLVSTIAGKTKGSGDGIGQEAAFTEPSGIALAENGDLYVTDFGERPIRVISPTGQVTTLVDKKFVRPSEQTMLRLPQGIAVDKQGNIFVVDSNTNSITKIQVKKQ